MPLNKKFLISVEALAFICVNGSENSISSKEICKNLGLKLRYLEQIMQILVKAGILKGSRGAKGGYKLNLERRKIKMSSIYIALKDVYGYKKPNNHPLAEITLELNNQIDSKIIVFLENITLEDIFNKTKKLKFDFASNNRTDFVI
jgi:Rrf2 family protein